MPKKNKMRGNAANPVKPQGTKDFKSTPKPVPKSPRTVDRRWE